MEPRGLIDAGDVADHQLGGPPRHFVIDRFWVVHLDPADDAPIEATTRGEPIALAPVPGRIAAFGVDAAGEVYALAFDSPVLQIVER